MVASDRSKIDPAILPPSPRVAFYHGLRVYHQMLVWTTLSDNDINPLLWGWRMVQHVNVANITEDNENEFDRNFMDVFDV